MNTLLKAPYINKLPLEHSNKTDWKGLEQYLHTLTYGNESDYNYAIREAGNLFSNYVPIEKRVKDGMPPALPRVKNAVATQNEKGFWEYAGIISSRERTIRSINSITLKLSPRDKQLYIEKSAVLKYYDAGWVQLTTEDFERYASGWGTAIKWVKYYDGADWITCYSLIPQNIGIFRTSSTTGWTDLSSGALSDRWLMAGSSYAAVSSANSHSHTGTVVTFGTTGADALDSGALYERSGYYGHLHTSVVSHSCSSVNAYPSRSDFRVYSASSHGNTYIPSGSIIMWTGTSGSPPTGWTYRPTNNGYHIRANASGAGSNTGSVYSATHTHASFSAASVNSGEVRPKLGSGATSGTYNVNHSHSVTAHTHTNSYTASYFDVILITNTSDVGEIPVNGAVITTATPAALNSTVYSRITGADDKLIRSASTYGGSGGTATHVHSHSAQNTLGATIGTSTPSSNSGSIYPISVDPHTHPIHFTTHPAATNFPYHHKVLLYKRDS